MGACCSNSKNTSTTALTPSPQQFDLKSDPKQPHNDHHVSKKEIFVIKHRISHEIHTHPDDHDPNNINPSATTADAESRNAGGARSRTPSCTKEEVDAILIQCGRLSRSNSAGAQNPKRRRRRHSGSKRSFDFDLNARLKNYEDGDNDDGGGGLNHLHRQQEARVSSPSRRSSRERDPRQQRSGSKERGSGRRISISPSRRSESPFRSLNEEVTGAGGSNKPAKMVPVPATDKSNNSSSDQVVVGSVKRIHVKRNVGAASPRSRSPAKTNLRVFGENQSQEQTQTSTREADHLLYRRKSLAEIDNNAARSLPSGNTKMAAIVPASIGNPTRIRQLSRDLDINPETMFDPSSPSYASLLLEDIHKFHQKNTNAAVTAPPEFSLPACVTKACSIMEAVADLNSTSSLFSDDRWRNPTTIERRSRVESETVVNGELLDCPRT